MADREAQIRDKVLDGIEEAITKFHSDMRATKMVRQPDGTVVEQPAWIMTPRDLAVLLDRFQVLVAQPSSISQHQGITLTSEIPAETLREFVEATRGLGGPPSVASPIPRASRRTDD